MPKRLFLAIGITVFLGGCAPLQEPAAVPDIRFSSASASIPASAASSFSVQAASSVPAAAGVLPIADARSRITKKPFGIQVSPSSSPVSPEKFSGYHTGVDFEAFPSEQESDVPVAAICAGNVRFRGWVNGYGGVVITDCVFGDQPVTVLYGHVNIDSVALRVGDDVAVSAFIGNLGKGNSTQTDGERKHLHLSIHKGTALEFRGYVATESALEEWMDPLLF